MNLHRRIPLAKTIATGFSLLSLTTFADHYWKGGGTTSDWTDPGNWINALDNGNAVFGGGKIGDLPNGLSTATFTNKVTIGHGIWIENDEGEHKSTGVVWELGEDATSDAGIDSEWGNSPSVTLGTGKSGQLTINSGTFTFPKGIYIATGGGESSLTMNGGSLSAGEQIQVGKNAGNVGTVTINDGLLYSSTFVQIGLNGTGYLNMNGGKLASGGPVRFATDSANSGASVQMAGGEIESQGNFVVGNKGVVDFSMSGGTIKTSTAGEFWVGGEQLSGAGTFVMTDGLVDLHNWASIGRYGPGRLELKGGTFQVLRNGLEIARYGNSTGSVVVAGGSLKYTGDKYFAVCYEGDYGELIVSNGTVNVNTYEIQIAKGAGKTGYLEVSGGSLKSQGTISVGNRGTGSLHLNGGTLQMNKIAAGDGAGTVLLNGGTLMAYGNTESFIPQSDNLAVGIGEDGVAFDTLAYNVTVAATLAKAGDFEGNGTIEKKGLGTLTISSDLDLERTFKFTIDTDLGEAGIGPIALTGTNNTLAAGGKISVEIVPENIMTETEYVLITGLTNELTMASVEISGDSFYVYTGKLENGTLSVSMSLREGAPAKARYVDNAWKYYDNDGNVLPPSTEESIHTYYVFTGTEPAADMLAKAATNKILFEATKSGDNAVTNTIAIPADFAPKYLRVETDECCAVAISGNASTFSPVKFVNMGTIVFDGDITADAAFTSGTISIAEGAVLRMVKSQAIAAYVEGKGELLVQDSTLTVNHTKWFMDFDGTITLSANGVLAGETELHNDKNGTKVDGKIVEYGYGNATIKLAGGSISHLSAGQTAAEKLHDVVFADGTESVWNNLQGRGGAPHIHVMGAVTGSGTVKITHKNRGFNFYSDLSAFTGTMEIDSDDADGKYNFRAGIKGGTVIMLPNAKIEPGSVAVTNATVHLKNLNPDTDYSFASSTLGTTSATTVKGVTFAEGAVVELLDEGALSDTTQTYVALTSATPIARPLPTLANGSTKRGKWRLTVKELTEEETTVYQLVAEFRKGGLCVVIQ